MKRYALAGAAAALLAVPALAAQGPNRTPGQPVTRAEMQARVQAQFARADADRDGFVTQAEAQAAADRWKGTRGAGRGNFFERLDANKDGSISRAEAEAVPARANRQGNGERRAGMFARLDANNDGMVTRAEFDARRGLRAAHAARLGGKIFSRADSDGDGRISLAEATAQRLARFDRRDANRDGTLTREERRAHRAQRKARPAG
jgi:Ca2+-binding EF-hand superfamily protein